MTPEDISPEAEVNDALPTEEAARRSAPARKSAPRKSSGKSRSRKKKRRKKKKSNPVVTGVLIVILLLALGLVGAGGYMAYRVSLVDTVFPGTEVAGIPLEGLSYSEAAERLLALGAEKYDGLTVTARLPLDNELTISAWEAGLRYSPDDAARAAWLYGRSGNLLSDTLTYVKAAYLGKNDFQYDGQLRVSLDEQAVRDIVAQAAVSIDEQLLRSGIDIGESEIRITKGASGLTLDEEAVTKQFIDALLAGDGTGFVYESEPDPDETFDFQALYDELYAEKAEAQLLYAKDYGIQVERSSAILTDEAAAAAQAGTETPAEGESAPAAYPPLPEGFDFEGKPYGITRSVVGVSFDVAAAEKAWRDAAYGETVAIPLTIDKPEMSTEDYEAMLFADGLSKNWTMVRLNLIPDMILESRTSALGSTNNRISNLRKACGLLNGIEIMPGETFSYNLALGERTAEGGWLPAPAYADGEVKQEYGGGICQVSSTLFNAVLYSNLKIVERECHQFQVGYLPAGMDATVSWGWPDFKFCNNKEYPIRINAWFDEDTKEVCVRIDGTDTEHQYVIIKYNAWKLYDDADEDNPKPRHTGTGAWIGRFVYNDGDDYNTAAAQPGSPNYETYSKYHLHDD